MATIKIKNLTKKYKDVTAVNNVSLDVLSGEVFALLGVNGAGKTTLIKILTGLTTKTSGEIFYNDIPLEKNLENVKQIINVSPQETAIAENLTVQENLLFMAEIYGLNKLQATNKAQELISALNLTSVQNKKSALLSGGYKRRLSIAMALISSPQVLFLDEPTLGLDVISRAELWDLIGKLKSKMTIILTTHYIEEAESLADRVAIMSNGNLIALDTPNNLITNTNSTSLEQAFIKLVKGEI